MIKTHKVKTLVIHSATDVTLMCQTVRDWAQTENLSLLNQTAIVTAASELAHNMINYAGGGQVDLAVVCQGVRSGLRLTFTDQGPGIPDVELALQNGYTTGQGMGLGLGGTQRLVNEFVIDSQVGVGTKIMITQWR